MYENKTHDVSIVIRAISIVLFSLNRCRCTVQYAHTQTRASHGSINNYNRGQNTIISDYTYAQIPFIISAALYLSARFFPLFQIFIRRSLCLPTFCFPCKKKQQQLQKSKETSKKKKRNPVVLWPMMNSLFVEV